MSGCGIKSVGGRGNENCEDIDINFNAKYIVDALSIVVGDSVTFSVAGAGKPMVMNDVPNKGFTYLVMPMNR